MFQPTLKGLNPWLEIPNLKSESIKRGIDLILMEQLPPGFRFYPTEEELITFYLHNKFYNQRSELDRVIPSIDIYNFEPSQLPGIYHN